MSISKSMRCHFPALASSMRSYRSFTVRVARSDLAYMRASALPALRSHSACSMPSRLIVLADLPRSVSMRRRFQLRRSHSSRSCRSWASMPRPESACFWVLTRAYPMTSRRSPLSLRTLFAVRRIGGLYNKRPYLVQVRLAQSDDRAETAPIAPHHGVKGRTRGPSPLYLIPLYRIGRTSPIGGRDGAGRAPARARTASTRLTGDFRPPTPPESRRAAGCSPGGRPDAEPPPAPC